MKSYFSFVLFFVLLFSNNIHAQELKLKNLQSALSKKTLNLSELKGLGYKYHNKTMIGKSNDTISIDLGFIMWKGTDEKIFKNLEQGINQLDTEKQEYTEYQDSDSEKRYNKSVVVNGVIYNINIYYFNNKISYYTVEILNDDYASDGE